MHMITFDWFTILRREGKVVLEFTILFITYLLGQQRVGKALDFISFFKLIQNVYRTNRRMHEIQLPGHVL